MTKGYWLKRAEPTQREVHFGDRVVRCFADRPSNLNDMLHAAAERQPEREALVCGAVRYSWRALDVCVGRVAAGLAAQGVGKGDRVALLLGNCSEFVIAWFATMRLGAVVVPLSIREQSAEIAYALNHCGARVIVLGADLATRLPEPAVVPTLLHQVFVGRSHPAESFAGLQQAGQRDTANAVSEEDTLAVLYTSGTTGRPKGAMLTHLGVIHSAMHYVSSLNLTAEDRCVAAVPLSHVTGIVAMVATMLCCGGTLIILPEFKAQSFLQLAAQERMTYTLLVPAMYNLCLLQADIEKYDLSAWRIGGYGGALMPPATLERIAARWPSLRLANAYGATETSSPSTILPPQHVREHGDSVGFAVACADIVVMDEQGREVPPGESGEIWIRGPMVVPGYWQDQEATAKEFTAGWWHSGDIGAVDGDGYLCVFDRKKDMINRGGYKVYSAEVESILAQHPAVLESAVIGVPCAVLGERVHAFVVLRDPGSRDSNTTAEALRDHCASQLSDYKVPETIVIGSDPLPRNANGKVLKRVLRERRQTTPTSETT
jgi:long-chain acyl-CoA synthetase